MIKTLHGEGTVEVFSAKRWDSRNREDLIESVIPCHDAEVVGPGPVPGIEPRTPHGSICKDSRLMPFNPLLPCLL